MNSQNQSHHIAVTLSDGSDKKFNGASELSIRCGSLRESAMLMLPKDLPSPAFGHVMGHGIEAGECGSYLAYYYPDQLYNLAADPGEQKKLAGDSKYNKRLLEIKELLRRHVAT